MTDPFRHNKRGSMTAQRVARIFAAHGGKCHKCTRKLGPRDSYIVEHLIALENGGTDEDENLALTCDWCRPLKDAQDHAIAGHSRRVYTRHNVPREYRRSKSWRS